MQARLSLSSSKTYTDILILSLARCYLVGSQRSQASQRAPDLIKGLNQQSKRRRRNPWVKGSIDCGSSRIRTDPFGPTNLTPMGNALFLCAELLFQMEQINDSRAFCCYYLVKGTYFTIERQSFLPNSVMFTLFRDNIAGSHLHAVPRLIGKNSLLDGRYHVE